MNHYHIRGQQSPHTIRTIYGIGRNYAAHAAELNNPVPDRPIIFIKPLSSVCYNGDTVLIPKLTNDVHHEVELLLSIAKSGKHIPKDDAWSYVEAAGLVIDFTARDLQAEAARNGHPWAVAKGFDTFTAISDLKPLHELDHPEEAHLELKINGEVRQSDPCSLMLFPVPDILFHLSQVVTLQPGDLIMTGTPKGVGPIADGDHITASLNGEQMLELHVAKA
jgi:2-keto-4-pentenoate hydratase/2-oxohepta-3-ene-1,7-dioic acid hydratase in catechol pathway